MSYENLMRPILVIGNPLGFQFFHNAHAGTLTFLDFPDRSDHGEHNGNFTVNRCPVQSATGCGIPQDDSDRYE